MSPPPPHFDPASLLAEVSWLRALARRLVRDDAQADDLAQDAALAALRREPDAGRPLRGWLATVLRHRRHDEARTLARREAREVRAAAGEALPSSAELAERLELHRRLVEAVERLDEPFRTAVLLRWFEDLEPAAIAARLGVPLETVRSRLKRGLARLRADLDRQFGERRTWLAAFLPLVGPAEGTKATGMLLSFGVLLVSPKILVFLVGALLLGAAVFVVRLDSSGEAPREVAAVTAAAPAGGAAMPPDLQGPAPRRTVAPAAPAPVADVGSPATPAASEPQAAPAAVRVRGRVLDADGLPAGFVSIRATVGGAERVEIGSSRADGGFDLEAPAEWRQLEAHGEGLVPVLGSMRGFAAAGDEAPDEHVLVVAPAARCAGSVVDQDGLPVAGAEVRVRLPQVFRARFPLVLDRSVDHEWRTASGVAGAFDLDFVPRIAGASLAAERGGCQPLAQPVPDVDRTDLTLVLVEPRLATEGVEGQVVDPDGLPVEDALVSLRGETTRSDASGRFRLSLRDAAWIDRISGEVGRPAAEVKMVLGKMGFGEGSAAAGLLLAVKEGFAPARVEAPRGAEGPLWPSFVLLQLGAEALSIEGTVIGAHGTPLHGARVWLIDPTLLGMIGSGPAVLETAGLGAEQGWNPVDTDADGRFVLRGLLDRSYRIAVMDPESLLQFTSAPIAAGTRDVVVRMPADAVHSRVTGRVRSRGGRPIEDARVHSQRDVLKVGMSTWHAGGEVVLTDRDGRFELRDVPKEGVYLRVDGEDILPLEYGRARPRLDEETGGRVLDLELEVDLRCHLRVELAVAAEADAIRVLDAAGRPLVLDLFVGEGRRSTPVATLAEGRSEVLAVSDAAATLVLLRDSEEVRRLPLLLEPGRVNVVRP